MCVILVDGRVVDWTDRNCCVTAQASSALLTLQDTGATSKKHSPVKQGQTKPAVVNVKKTSTSNVFVKVIRSVTTAVSSTVSSVDRAANHTT